MPTCFRLSAFQMITVLCIILKQKESLAGLPKWVHRTESCPMPNNLTAWMKASERLNCLDSLIANSIKQLQHVYHCMPSAFLNESLEFCSPVTRILNASCAVYTYFDNDLLPNYTPNSKSCSTFRKGCPLTEYFSNDIYKYEECFNFNSKHGCYYGDPNCEEYIEITMDYTKEVYFTSELQRDISTTENDIMKSNAEQSRRFNVSEGLLIFFFILCCVLVAYIILQRKKKKNRYKGKARPVTDVLKELEREEQAEEGTGRPSTDEAKESERKDQAEEEAPLIRDTATVINVDISPISRLLGEIASEIPAEKIPKLKCNLMLNIGENTEERKKISGLDCYGVLVYMDSLYDFRLNLYILMGYLEAIKEEKQLKKCMKFVKNADYPLNYYTRKRTFFCWKYSDVYLKVAMDIKKCRHKDVFKITMNLVNLLGCKKDDIMIRGISEGCILLHYHVKSTLLETLRNCDFSSMRKNRVFKISILEECIFYCQNLDDNFHKDKESRSYIHRLFNTYCICKNTCPTIRDIIWKGTQTRSMQKTSKESMNVEMFWGTSMELSTGKINKEESLRRFEAVQDQNSKCLTYKDKMSLISMDNSGGNVYVSLGVIVLAIVFSIMMITWMNIVYVEQSSKIIILVVLLIFNLLGSVSQYFLHEQCIDDPNIKHKEHMKVFTSKLIFLLLFGIGCICHCFLYFKEHLTSNYCPDAILEMLYYVCTIIYTFRLFIVLIYCHHRHGENTFAQNVWSVGLLLANFCMWLDIFFSESDDLFNYSDDTIKNDAFFNESNRHNNCTYNVSMVSVIKDSEAHVVPAIAEFTLLATDILFLTILIRASTTVKEITQTRKEGSTYDVSRVSERPKYTRSVAFVLLQLIVCTCCLGFITFPMFVLWHRNLVSNEDLNDEMKLRIECSSRTIVQLCLKFVMMCLILPLIISCWKSFEYKFNVWAFVLIISCFCNVVYHMFYIFALVKCRNDISDSVSQRYFIFSWIGNIISIIIAWAQTLFILGTHDKLKFIGNTCCYEKTIYNKSSQIFFFLGIMNLCLWVNDSVVEVREPSLSLIPFRYIDLEFWDVMTKIILPFTIFFRFHTGLDFLTLWWEGSDVKNIFQDNMQIDGIEECIISSN